MPTFIDESSDIGFQPDSAPYFRLAAIWVPSSDEAAGFRRAVAEIRFRHNLATDYEFKFAETGRMKAVCEEFFRSALSHHFRFSVCCIDKRAEESEIRTKKQLHYLSSMSIATAMRQVYERDDDTGRRRSKEPVTVDDNGDRKYLDTLDHAFRDMMSSAGTPLVGRPRFKDSHSDELIQLADMTCGAVGQHIENYPCRDRVTRCFYDLIRPAGLGVCCGWGPGVNCLK
jgi:Protein of unknown function (DUF3800)